MAYFPFFVDLEGKRGLIIGGGQVALRKAERLLPFGPQLTAAAPAVLPALAALPGVTVLQRPFGEDLLEDGPFFVIAAADDPAVNCRAAAACRTRGIPVNVVDDREACSFLFPALVQEGKLTVGISTGGASPTAAIYMKQAVQQALPENFAAMLDWLAAQRAAVQAQIGDEGARAAVSAALFAACLEAGGPPAPEVLQALLQTYGGKTP